MRIALCLSGQMRAMKHCIDTLEIAFPDCDVDVYATVWNYEDRNNIELLREKTNVVYIDTVTDDDLATNIEFEKQVIRRGFYSQYHIKNWAPIPVWNLCRIERMAKLSFIPVAHSDCNIHTSGDEYDFVVRSRYDTKYLRNILPMLDKTKLLVSEDIGGSAPWDIWKETRMIYDGFAASSYPIMHEYYRFSNWLPSYFEYHRDTLKAERTLGWFLEKIVALPMKFDRDFIGLQVNETEWYNRSNPIETNSLQDKQKETFDFYKSDLKKNHPDLYNEVAFCFE